jgi:hypothetical protein
MAVLSFARRAAILLTSSRTLNSIPTTGNNGESSTPTWLYFGHEILRQSLLRSHVYPEDLNMPLPLKKRTMSLMAPRATQRQTHQKIFLDRLSPPFE